MQLKTRYLYEARPVMMQYDNHQSKRLFSSLSLFLKKRLTKIPKHRLYILSLANGCYALPVLISDKTPCGIPNLVYQY